MFSVYFGLLNKIFSLKNRKLFLETENEGKKQLPNIPYGFLSVFIDNFGMDLTGDLGFSHCFHELVPKS